MSSILKSLRKLESQKRGGSRAPDLMVDQGGGAAPKPSALLPLVAGIALGALVVVLVLFLVLRGQDVVSPPVTASKPMPGHPDAPAPVPATSPARDARPDPVAEPPARVVSAPVSRPQFSGPILPAVQADQRSTVAGAVVEEPAVKGVAAAPRAQATGAKPLSAAGAVKSPVAAAAKQSPGVENRPALQVTEIFYQDDRSNSMAVVNDLPVMVGTQVDSAVVQEILPDAVVFVFGDRTVTVPVTKP